MMTTEILLPVLNQKGTGNQTHRHGDPKPIASLRKVKVILTVGLLPQLLIVQREMHTTIKMIRNFTAGNSKRMTRTQKIIIGAIVLVIVRRRGRVPGIRRP
jgi:hypothetical protein